MTKQIFKYSFGGCIVLHARVIDFLLCISNGRPERADGRVDRRTGSQTAAWTCSHEGMSTPCCYLHAFGTCSGCLATCMFTNLNYLHALGNRRRTDPCGQSGRMDVWKGADRQPDSRVDVRPRRHAHAMLLFARSWHLQWMPCDVHVRSRGTAGAARVGG